MPFNENVNLDPGQVQDRRGGGIPGDDRIQRRTQGRINPDAWTHGSSEQRQRWFLAGLKSGTMDNCDTSRGSL